MKNKSKKRKRLNAKQFHEKITKARKYLEKEFGCITWHGTNDRFGEIIAELIHSGLITHDKGTDSYHFGLILACILNVKRANGKKENLKHTAIHEGIKKGKSNLNYENKRVRK